MLFDTHSHTTMSSDSKMEPADAVQAAKKQGLGIIFTEHIDLGYYYNDRDFRTDPAVYLPAYQKFRSGEVLLGIEIGLTDDSIEKNVALVEKYQFDYIIGSVHLVNGYDIFLDFFTQNKTEEEYYTEYLTCVLDMVNRNPFFHSLGHIDYPSRYSKLDNPEITYDKYHLLYNEIFKSLLDTGRIMELNTRRLDNPGAVRSMSSLFRAYRKQGGRYVTVGSDAHRVESVGIHFDKAIAIVEEIGLTPVFYREGKMELCK